MCYPRRFGRKSNTADGCKLELYFSFDGSLDGYPDSYSSWKAKIPMRDDLAPGLPISPCNADKGLASAATDRQHSWSFTWFSEGVLAAALTTLRYRLNMACDDML
jgi:hypothetical protein